MSSFPLRKYSLDYLCCYWLWCLLLPRMLDQCYLLQPGSLALQLTFIINFTVQLLIAGATLIILVIVILGEVFINELEKSVCVHTEEIAVSAKYVQCSCNSLGHLCQS